MVKPKELVPLCDLVFFVLKAFEFRGARYASSRGIFSSMAISRNSLASNTSRQSSHSTYSASSSRETTRTLGCLQGSVIEVHWAGNVAAKDGWT